MAQAGIKKCQIGALKPGNNDFIVVALVINKPDPRKVVMRKDGGERWVSVFTLSDQPHRLVQRGGCVQVEGGVQGGDGGRGGQAQGAV